MLNDIEKARLTVMQARRQECEEWQIVAKAVEKSIQAPEPPGAARELLLPALWVLAVVVVIVVLLVVGR